MAVVMSESFENTGSPGYDNTWSETLGSGSTLDENNTDVARPTGGGNQVLKVVKVSPNFNARAAHNLGSELAITYNTCYVRINATDIAASGAIRLFSGMTSSSTFPWNIRLLRSGDGATYSFSNQYYNNGATRTSTDATTISFDTWYRLRVKYDYTNTAWGWYVDDRTILEEALTGTYRPGAQYIHVGDASTANTLTAYFDLVSVQDTAWDAGTGVNAVKYYTGADWARGKVYVWDGDSWNKQPVNVRGTSDWEDVEALG